MKLRIVAAATLLALGAAASAQERDQPAQPVFLPDGTVKVPPFELPPSIYMSKEATEFQKLRARVPMGTPPPMGDIVERRRLLEQQMAPRVALMRKLYPVDVEPATLGGVPVRVITPQGRKPDPKRVLVNLHGGAFSLCADACAMVESIPIAALGGFRVITVDYRMAPEYRHPAAVEDVEKVYRELLRDYRPGRIGIYGCSAGGALTAQAAAWLPAKGLPQAGAIGIFGAGGVRFGQGDSAYFAGYGDGSFPPPPPRGAPPAPPLDRGYFGDVDKADPFVSPAMHMDVLAKFPPALVITGTRAMDMSPAVFTNSQLLKAGRRSTLVVAEGMGHCYMYNPELPESRDAYDVTVRFFRENLR